MTREGSPKSQRRAILKATGAAAGVGLLGRMAMAQNGGGNNQTTTTTTNETQTTETTDTTATNGDDGQRTIILGGRVSYWLGLNPEVIAGAENPTLGLVPDEEYRLIWINLDGARHAFQILGQGGNVLESTGTTAQQGATREITFRAETDMRRYRCRFHPDSMRGDINRSGEFATTSGTATETETNETTETNGTETTDGTFTTETDGTDTTDGTFTTGTTETTDGTFTTDGFTTDTTTN